VIEQIYQKNTNTKKCKQFRTCTWWKVWVILAV